MIAGGDPRLVAEETRRTMARLDRVGRRLARGDHPARRSRDPFAAAPILAAFGRAITSLPHPERASAVAGPDVRGFLGEAELWIDVLDLAAALRRRARHGRRSGSRRRVQERLFDRIARTEHLATLLPAGRIDAGFASRAGRFARVRIRQALADLAALVVGLRLAGAGGDPFETRLEFRADPEQGRPAGRIDLGAVAGPAGPLSIVASGRLRRRPRVRARLVARTLVLTSPGLSPIVLPAAGSRLSATDLPSIEALRSAPRGRPALRLARRPMIPGTSIILAPRVDSSARRLEVRREIPGLGMRFAAALRIVRLAWPEAHREITARTFMVVPVRERGLVSYSLASRPGVSFINVSGKTLLDLADDLLHESAHHRLHALEEVQTLLTPGPETDEVQAFDSPWRGALRPLHGILHGGYTFLFRAELLQRVLRAARARPRLLGPLLRPRGADWIRRELRREEVMIASALRDLGDAARQGLLTADGRRLLASMRARALDLTSARPARAPLRGGAAGWARGPRRSASFRRAR